MNDARKKLEEHGYKVKIFTPYHWEVSKPGTAKVVSVWPTAHKILVKYESGPAPRYSGSLFKAVEKCFAPLVLPPVWTPEQLVLMQPIFELRERGLDYIREHYPHPTPR